MLCGVIGVCWDLLVAIIAPRDLKQYITCSTAARIIFYIGMVGVVGSVTRRSGRHNTWRSTGLWVGILVFTVLSESGSVRLVGLKNFTADATWSQQKATNIIFVDRQTE